MRLVIRDKYEFFRERRLGEDVEARNKDNGGVDKLFLQLTLDLVILGDLVSFSDEVGDHNAS